MFTRHCPHVHSGQNAGLLDFQRVGWAGAIWSLGGSPMGGPGLSLAWQESLLLAGLEPACSVLLKAESGCLAGGFLRSAIPWGRPGAPTTTAALPSVGVLVWWHPGALPLFLHSIIHHSRSQTQQPLCDGRICLTCVCLCA